MSLDLLKAQLRERINPKRAAHAPGFFKAIPGGYGEGDKFLGIAVPDSRRVARTHRKLPLPKVEKLLQSPWHEERLTALFILVEQFKRGDADTQKAIYDLYMRRLRHINNWDLVDSSAHFIVGPHIADRGNRIQVLRGLAHSEIWWERRIAMIATYHFIRECGRAEEALEIAELLVDDSHDLIQKAVGWMLRELGARVSLGDLEAFLDRHAATMPRTALRYAIEHFPEERRQHYLQMKNR